MKLRLTACLLSCLGSVQPAAYAEDVSVCTDLGRFDIELFEEEAPKHVANFLDYVNQGLVILFNLNIYFMLEVLNFR